MRGTSVKLSPTCSVHVFEALEVSVSRNVASQWAAGGAPSAELVAVGDATAARAAGDGPVAGRRVGERVRLARRARETRCRAGGETERPVVLPGRRDHDGLSGLEDAVAVEVRDRRIDAGAVPVETPAPVEEISDRGVVGRRAAAAFDDGHCEIDVPELPASKEIVRVPLPPVNRPISDRPGVRPARARVGHRGRLARGSGAHLGRRRDRRVRRDAAVSGVGRARQAEAIHRQRVAGTDAAAAVDLVDDDHERRVGGHVEGENLVAAQAGVGNPVRRQVARIEGRRVGRHEELGSRCPKSVSDRR